MMTPGLEKKTLEGDHTLIIAKKGKTSKRLAWADEVGGELLAICGEYDEENGKLPASSKSFIRGKLSAFIEVRNDTKFKQNLWQAKKPEAGEPNRCRELWRGSSCMDEDDRKRSTNLEAEKGKLPAFSKSFVRGKLRDFKENRIDDKLKK